MASNISSNFSAMQQINRTMNQLASVQKSNRDKVVEHMNMVQNKTDQSAGEVVSTAVQLKASNVETKGRMIDVMA